MTSSAVINNKYHISLMAKLSLYLFIGNLRYIRKNRTFEVSFQKSRNVWNDNNSLHTVNRDIVQ
jgi:hypothetical protein